MVEVLVGEELQVTSPAPAHPGNQLLLLVLAVVRLKD